MGPLGDLNDRFGRAVAWLGNANGDPTTDEFVVGAPFDGNAAGDNAGAIWILSIDASNLVVHEQEIVPGDVGITHANDWGQSLAAIADLDENGVPDLAVGAVNCDNTGGGGCVNILQLGPDGAGGVQILSSTELGKGRAGLPDPLDTLFRANSLAWINDVPDGAGGVLAVGEDSLSEGVYLIHLLADGTARDYYRIFEGAGVGEDLVGGLSDTGFGWSVAGPGDIDGDGVADLIVGATDAQRAPGGSFSTRRRRRLRLPDARQRLRWTRRQPGQLPGRARDRPGPLLQPAPAGYGRRRRRRSLRRLSDGARSDAARR